MPKTKTDTLLDLDKSLSSYNLDDFGDLLKLVKETDSLKEIQNLAINHVKKIISEFNIQPDPKVIFIFDPDDLIRDYTADQIYNAVSEESPSEKNIILIIHSNGGSIEPAYMISKCCKELGSRFIVVVPRLAKSAATLISLGADEIHMGQMSQLGPIDPQIGGLPALGLGNALEYLAGLCKKHPESSKMFADYLSSKLDLSKLGYFERVTESAVQYAERLLEGNEKLLEKSTKIAQDLVYSYKDHSFVIDHTEAKKFLGDTIKCNTDEYKMSDKIHKFLENLQLLVQVFRKHKVSRIGSLDRGLSIDKIKDIK